MDERFSKEQWNQCEEAAEMAISDARRSSHVVIEMLRIWNDSQLETLQQGTNIKPPNVRRRNGK